MPKAKAFDMFFQDSNSSKIPCQPRGCRQNNTSVAPDAKRSKTESRVTADYVNFVREKLELVMGQYMGKNEAVDFLFEQAAIDPLYTRAVWMMLEEKNRDFFKAYYKRVLLKKQIAIFISQVEQHLQVMKMIELVQSESKQIENNSLPVDDNCTWKSQIRTVGESSTHDRINGSSPQRDLPPIEETVEINGSAGLKNGSEDVYEGEDGLNAEEFAEVEFIFPELSECNMSTIFSNKKPGEMEKAYYGI